MAAGSGERLGADRPKAFVALAGRSLLEWSLRAIAQLAVPGDGRAAADGREAAVDGGDERHGGAVIGEVVLAVPAGPRWARAAREDAARAGLGAGTPVHIVPGGAARSHSVRSALAAARTGVERVVVHDAARPLVDPALFAATLAALDDADAAVAAARVTDTIKDCGSGRTVRATLDRSRLWAVQTPQAFRAGALRAALAQPDAVLAAVTDDAALIEAAGGRVVVVESSAANLKVTTPHDLRVAEFLLAGQAAAC